MAQMQGAAWTDINGPPGKWTMRCGDLEVVVVLRDHREDQKVHVYTPEEKMKRVVSNSLIEGQIFINGRQCVPIMTWFCPAEREC
jgi:hypothetical protein